MEISFWNLIGRFERRLLHPGANTADIITQYISYIKVRDVCFSSSTRCTNKQQTNKQTNKQTNTCSMVVKGLLVDGSSCAQDLYYILYHS